MTDFAPVSYDVTTNNLQYDNGAGPVTIPYTGPAGPQGLTGATGATGASGSNGVGVPAAGTIGQVLTKNSATDYDTIWATPASGGGSAANYINIEDYGCVGDGITDNTINWNSAYDAAAASSHKCLSVPAKTYAFNSAPKNNADGVKIIGVDKSYSVLLRNYSGDFITFTGANAFNGGMENIALVAASGTSTGTALTIQPTNSSLSPDYSSWRNVLITGWGGTFYYGIIGNGLSRVAPNPNGLRDIDMRDITIFECTAAAAEFDAMTSTVIDNLQTYGGSAGTGQVYIGASSGSDHLNTFLMTNATITGTLSVQNVDACFYATGAFNNVTLASTVAKAVMSGTKSGTLSNSAAASNINLI